MRNRIITASLASLALLTGILWFDSDCPAEPVMEPVAEIATEAAIDAPALASSPLLPIQMR